MPKKRSVKKVKQRHRDEIQQDIEQALRRVFDDCVEFGQMDEHTQCDVALGALAYISSQFETRLDELEEDRR